MTAPVDRRAARVLLLDDRDRVLLFHGCDPSDAGAGDWWFTPGGGVDAGETTRDAAVRELREETGLDLAPEALGRVVHERTATFRFAGGHWRSLEEYYLARVEVHEVDTSGFTALEVAAVLGHRWWTRDELARTGERVYPEELLDVLARAA